MEQERKETLTIRIVSTTFVVVALAVFKPFGLDMSQWQAYAHLLAWWVLGIAVCILSEIIMTYVIKAPRSFNHGVSYIIRRNLCFMNAWTNGTISRQVHFGTDIYRLFDGFNLFSRFMVTLIDDGLNEWNRSL